MFVDGLTLHAVDRSGQVARVIQKACSRAIQLLDVELELSISRDQRGNWLDPAMKTIMVASSRDVVKAVAPGMRRLGIKRRSKAKVLGVDSSCGKRVVRRARRGSAGGHCQNRSLQAA